MHYSYTAVALASLAAVNALPTQRLPGQGITIPLAKRAAFTPAQGKAQIQRLANKYAHTLNNYVLNKGVEHPLAKSTLAQRSAALKKRQSEPLTDEQSNAYWQGEITVGGQKIAIDFDTGSSDLWVPGKQISSAQETYDPSQSSTAKEVASSGFQIQYGDGSTASGPIYTDTVEVGGVSVTDQTFSPVDQDTIQQGTGILGMGFESISSLNATPYFQTAVQEGAVKTGQFSFALTPSDAELYIGGSNTAKYSGDVTWVDVTDQSYWVTKGEMTANGQTGIDSSTPMIIDTGTSLIVGPSDVVDQFYQTIGGSPCSQSDCGASGYYTYDCSAKVTFKFGSGEFDISKTFSLGSVGGSNTTQGPGSFEKRQSGSCVGSLVGTDQVPLNGLIVGDTFFQEVYSIFDVDNNKIGFANIA